MFELFLDLMESTQELTFFLFYSTYLSLTSRSCLLVSLEYSWTIFLHLSSENYEF